jgi:hypothetical protein
VTETAEQSVVPPVSFRLPEGFREVYPRPDQEAGVTAAGYGELMAAVLAGAGVEFAALGLFRIDSEEAAGVQVAHCSLTVAAVPSDHPSAEVAANGIREIFVRDSLRDTRWLDLPCGPAVAVVSAREVRLRVKDGMDPAELPVGQVQVHVPFPANPWIAVFTLETTALEQWDEMCALMAEAVKSVRFTAEPGATTRPATPPA